MLKGRQLKKATQELLNRKPQEEKLLDLEVKLRRLEETFEVSIERSVRQLRWSDEEGRPRNPGYVTQVKSAYYSLLTVQKALEHLRFFRTDSELIEAMEQLNSTLNKVNKEGVSGKTALGRMKRTTEEMEAREQSWVEATLDLLVDDDTVNSLIAGVDLKELRCRKPVQELDVQGSAGAPEAPPKEEDFVDLESLNLDGLHKNRL